MLPVAAESVRDAAFSLLPTVTAVEPWAVELVDERETVPSAVVLSALVATVPELDALMFRLVAASVKLMLLPECPVPATCKMLLEAPVMLAVAPAGSLTVTVRAG